MSDYKIPTEATNQNIGKIVSVQIFRKDSDDPGMIDPKSLEQHVGILMSYGFNSKGFEFTLSSGRTIYRSWAKHVIEIYPKV